MPTPPPPRAMILAAGLGTRLRPLTVRTPKPLIEVAGHPLIAYGIGLLRSHGIEDVVVNLHHLGEQVVRALGDGASLGVRLHYSLETELLDTGGGIRQAAPLFEQIGRERGDPRGPIVIANSDVISEIPVSDVVRMHRERGALVTMVLRPDPRAAGYGLFGIDEAGRIRRFLGEGSDDPSLREMMFASLHVIDPSVIDRMPAGVAPCATSTPPSSARAAASRASSTAAPGTRPTPRPISPRPRRRSAADCPPTWGEGRLPQPAEPGPASGARLPRHRQVDGRRIAEPNPPC